MKINNLKVTFLKGIFILIMGVNVKEVFAQQNLFNIPSGDITPLKRVFINTS